MSAPDPGPDGVLVGRGGFKVDRAHALRKLKDYQLPSGVGGWLLWARCAAACGAAEAELKLDVTSFTLRFAGAPFTRAELEDPFAPLFAPRRAGRERGVTLALGLLQAFASRPNEVAIESGAGAERVRLTASSAENVAVAPASAARAETVLRVTWPLTEASRERFLDKSYLQFRSLPLFHPDRLKVTGDELSFWPADAAAGRAFRLGSAQGRLALPSFYAPPDSHLTLYKLGVFVCEHREPFRWAKVTAWVNDDKLALSANQSGVVPDARFKALMRLAAREAEALALEAAREHPELLASARAEMDRHAGARAVWDARLKWGPQAGERAATPGLFERLLMPDASERARRYRAVLHAAERTLWLRDVAARLKAPGRTPPPALAAAVTAALAGTERPD